MPKAPANKSAARSDEKAAGTAAANTSAAKKASSKKAAPKKAASKKAAGKASPAKKSAPKKASPKKAAGKASPAKKAAGKKTATKKSAAKKTAKKTAAAATTTRRSATQQAPASPAAATNAPKKAAKKAANGKAQPRKGSAGALAVRADESPWTSAELTELRGGLETEASRLRAEIAEAEEEIADLFRDGGDGAGHDQADVGSTTFERDHEMSLANHSRELLAQVQRALRRIDDGSYGGCESCGNPIGKLRLMAFPRATLCVTCKQRQERR